MIVSVCEGGGKQACRLDTFLTLRLFFSSGALGCGPQRAIALTVYDTPFINAISSFLPLYPLLLVRTSHTQTWRRQVPCLHHPAPVTVTMTHAPQLFAENPISVAVFKPLIDSRAPAA